MTTDLRADHVAVRMYEVHDEDWEDHTLTIASTLERSPDDDGVKLLSLQLFARICFEVVASLFVRWDCLPEVTYFFQAVNMSALCHGAAGRCAVTRMINSGAYPAIGATFSLVPVDDDDETARELAVKAVLS